MGRFITSVTRRGVGIMVEEKARPVSNVLVVEDNADDAFLTMRALEKLERPPAVRLASDGAEALAALAEVGNDPNLVFLDVKMPRVDGLEVLEKLTAKRRNGHIAVVMFSSSDDATDIQKALELGASEYLRKPVDFDAYTAVVQEIARRYLS